MHHIRDPKILRRFADQMRKIRKEKGLTQEELAHEAGLSLSQISRIETAQLNSSICTICRLAETLDVPRCDLISWDD